VTHVAPQEEFLELAGGRVHLLRGGTGEPVLFLHAAGGAGTWLPFHELLAGAGFEVIAPDHPGFGSTGARGRGGPGRDHRRLPGGDRTRPVLLGAVL
jgi:pimeloyl-ACP methyl ester carboxylesterase